MEEAIPIKKKKKAAIYIRVSTQDQMEDAYGPILQLDKIKRYLEFKNSEIELAGEEYIFQETISGATPISEREELTKLFEILKYKTIDGVPPFDFVIVYRIDRFARRLVLLLDIIEKLNFQGVGFISVQELIDTDTAFGKAMLGILGVFAELERDVIQQRTQAGRRQSQADGNWLQDVYGYTRKQKVIGKGKDVEIVKNEAEIIEEIFDDYVEKDMSIGQICNKLKNRKVQIPAYNRDNVKNKKSNPGNKYNWKDNTVRTILKNEVYIGRYYYGKTEKVDIGNGRKKQVILPKEQRILHSQAHMPIITEQTFFKAQEILERKGHYKQAETPYILSGLLKCDHCKKEENGKSNMRQWVGTKTNGLSCYICKGKSTVSYGDETCETIPLNKEELERFVIAKVKDLLKKPEAIKRLIKSSPYSKIKQSRLEKELQKVLDDLNRARAGLENLSEDYYNGKHGLDTKTYEEKFAAKQKTIENLTETLSQKRKDWENAVDDKKYVKGFQLVKELLSVQIDDILADPEKAKLLLQAIIKDIVIYSRAKKDGEVLLGRRKKGGKKQYIPHHIDINFKLPQEFFDEFLKEEMEKEPDSKQKKPPKGVSENVSEIKVSGKKTGKNRLGMRMEAVKRVLGIAVNAVVGSVSRLLDTDRLLLLTKMSFFRERLFG